MPKLPKAVWILVLAMAINTTGSSFLWPFNTLYIHEYLGESMTKAGMALFVNSALAIVGNYLGGKAFDRLGGKKTLVISVIGLVLSSVGLLLFHQTYVGYVAMLGLIGFVGGMVFPTIYAMTGVIWPEGGRRAFNAIYVAQNVGVALGTAVSGQIAAFSIQYIFIANLVLYIAFAIILFIGLSWIKAPARMHTTPDETETTRTPLARGAARTMLLVSIGYALLWFVYVQWQGTFAVHTKSLGVTISEYSILWTINGALIVFAQPLLTPILRWFGDDLKRQLMTGTGIFLLSYLIVPFAGGFKMFLVAMIILTIGEMFIWPAVPAMAARLAPIGKEGEFQGYVNIAASAGRMISPTVGGLIYDLSGMSAVFLTLIGLILLAGVVFLRAIPKITS
ncbi:multidrug MFS transporter [Exiguobacterium sp. BMC-KP]|uniref:MDR family MFS transporter n=1 Tax=Exiguobacterium sp. BMC-KP TaxID=1684312 RepID=UPI0006AA5A6A|nr:MFS transporter [Exiguobacterium sp. BMC-KP]KOP30023.1 multidrug MFS transporter [Exiguobacterium sp. BMC-KP]